MLAQRRLGTFGSLAFLNGLLMASAFTVPAYAQIETVVVTAEKKAENVQSVPISLTALTGEDLSNRQINTFQDLQFNVPSVTNTKTNFTSSNFEVRGIGSSGTGAATESGVAFNVNDFYLNSPAIAETEYYDVDRIEILRGPQSTLYGRNATGGSVNVITAKPDLDSFSANIQGEYGNYNDMKVNGAVNIPIVEGKLALRMSGLWWNRDGTSTNLYDNSKVDSRDQWSARGALRWEPASGTTIDLMVQGSSEESTRMRSQKSMCDFDPSGILGCLPDKLAFNTPNLNATLGNVFSSPQVYAAIFNELPANTQNYYNNVVAPLLGVTPAPGLSAGQTIFAGLGLGTSNIQAPQASGLNPANMHQINTDFDPRYRANELLVTGQWKQRLNDWLDATLLAGYQHAGVNSQQSYYNTVGSPIIVNQNTLNLIGAMASYPLLPPMYLNSAVASNFSLITPTSIGGGLYTLSIPVSAYDAGSAGSQGGQISHHTNLNSGSDQSSGSDVQKSVELRFNSNLAGPVNFLLAGYYLSFNSTVDYFVSTPGLDYTSLIVGGLAFPVTNASTYLGPLGPNTPVSTGVPMAVGPSVYHNAETYTLTSKAVFGELYYDAIPDVLKFTAGLRYTEDDKALRARTSLLNAFVPTGTTNLDSPIPYIALAPYGGLNAPIAFKTTPTKNTAMTGRFVVNYTPTLDFTDQTMIYASFARGYKAGGTNPGLPSSVPASLNAYAPEFVNAYELGTKNALLGGTVQANMDVWYYDYKALQVATIIDQDSVNQNINATMWGLEGEFQWEPNDRWAFNMSVANNHSDIGNSSLVDTRNPSANNPNATLVKDLSNAENCVVVHDAVSPPWSAVPTPVPFIHGATPTTNVNGVLTDSGYSSCAGIQQVLLATPALAAHYTFYSGGIPVSLKGNSLQNMPDASLGFGGQYTQPFDGGYSLTTRVDVYWQTSMWGTIFNDSPIDKVASYFVSNASMQLNAPDGKWYLRGFVNNMFDKTYVTGMYVSDPATGAFTNQFVGQPRTFGAVLGARF